MTKMTAALAASLFLLVLCPPSFAADKDKAPAKEPTVEEQLHYLTTMCAATDSARTARHAAKPLYERLGGYDKIYALTTEIVRLHRENEALDRIMKGVEDDDLLATRVAQFMSAGTGGADEVEYEGRDLVSSHKHLKLTDADFLAAGGDVIQAMKNKGYGEDEINEVVCILMSLKDKVVLKEDQDKAEAEQ